MPIQSRSSRLPDAREELLNYDYLHDSCWLIQTDVVLTEELLRLRHLGQGNSTLKLTYTPYSLQTQTRVIITDRIELANKCYRVYKAHNPYQAHYLAPIVSRDSHLTSSYQPCCFTLPKVAVMATQNKPDLSLVDFPLALHSKSAEIFTTNMNIDQSCYKDPEPTHFAGLQRRSPSRKCIAPLIQDAQTLY